MSGPAPHAEHLADLTTELPNIRLGIVPWTQPTNRPIIHGFQIFDERAVTLTTETSFALITDERDIADFSARFEIYAGFAVYGDEARAVFHRVAGEYRAMGAIHTCGGNDVTAVAYRRV